MLNIVAAALSPTVFPGDLAYDQFAELGPDMAIEFPSALEDEAQQQLAASQAWLVGLLTVLLTNGQAAYSCGVSRDADPTAYAHLTIGGYIVSEMWGVYYTTDAEGNVRTLVADTPEYTVAVSLLTAAACWYTTQQTAQASDPMGPLSRYA